MYTKMVPFKDFNGKPRNQQVAFNLTEREVIRLMSEFQVVYDWIESIKGPERELSTEEVVRFYNAFEGILLEAWGKKSEDGLHFRKGERYEFEESALFAACMAEFVANPAETGKMLEAIMPEGLEDLMNKVSENADEIAANPDSPDALKAEIARLRAQNSLSGVVVSGGGDGGTAFSSGAELQ